MGMLSTLTIFFIKLIDSSYLSQRNYDKGKNFFREKLTVLKNDISKEDCSHELLSLNNCLKKYVNMIEGKIKDLNLTGFNEDYFKKRGDNYKVAFQLIENKIEILKKKLQSSFEDLNLIFSRNQSDISS